MSIRSTLLTLALVFTTGSASANLIVNGSFENLDENFRVANMGSQDKWHIYSELPGWETTRGTEIWFDNFIVDAQDGNKVLELNAHPGDNSPNAFSIFQTIATEIGATYELSFWARARNSNNEAFHVDAGNLSQDVTDHVQGAWNNFVYNFVAQETSTTLSFTSLDPTWDTTGNLLDQVSVTQVPEPGTLALLAIGLAGLVLQRRHTAATTSKRTA